MAERKSYYPFPRLAPVLKGSQEEETLFWKLYDCEQSPEQYFKSAGLWVNERAWRNVRENVMRMFISSHGLCDPKRYQLFHQACQRLGADQVRALGVDNAVKEQRTLSKRAPKRR